MGFPVTLNCRTASQFEDRLDCRARRFLRMLVLFVVVIVDHEELVYFVFEFFHIFVVHSFAFSFCLRKIKSLI